MKVIRRAVIRESITSRKRTAELLEAHRPNDPTGRLIDTFLILLILANVIAVILETLPAFEKAHAVFFWRFEVFSVCIFTVEYFLRLWSCVEKNPGSKRSPTILRLKWMFSPLGLIDLLAIVPFYAYLFLPMHLDTLLILRVFRGIRLLRIFKLTRYSPAMKVLRRVMQEEFRTLMVVGFLLLVVMVVASWGIYILESKVQPEHFGSIPQAMWWAVVSLTTVGYGDVVPITPVGKMFAGFIALLGIGMAALPAGILAAGFASEMRRREQRFNRALNMVLADGVITVHEKRELERLREELGLSEEEAHSLLLDARKSWLKHTKCPHCGKHIYRS